MRTRLVNTLLVLVVFSVSASGQQPDTDAALEAYIGNIVDLQSSDEMGELLPSARPESFASYIAATSDAESRLRTMWELVESLRLNKLVGGASGGTGSTSLVSAVSAPAVIGFGLERGGILQGNSATATTFRANLLGLAKLAVGAEQFPYCPEVDSANCSTWSRRLRLLSGIVAFQSTTSPGQVPGSTDDLFGDEYRLSAWGLRLDLTPSNNLDDPKYVRDWSNRIAGLAGTDEVAALAEAVGALFGGGENSNPAITKLIADAESRMHTALMNAAATDQRAILKTHLDALIEQLVEASPDFQQQVQAVQIASEAYNTVRDAAVREAHVHKMSLEYMNLRPSNEPTRSTIRFIYSHQPTEAPLLVTLNFATSLYNQSTTAASQSRFRDLQFSAQLDRRLASTGRLDNSVLTFAAYYQWMKDDALILIPEGSLAPSETGIVLPSDASALLGTEGHIGIVQAKLTIPLGETVSVPVSVSWATRTEFIKEQDVRGQIGLTLDMERFGPWWPQPLGMGGVRGQTGAVPDGEDRGGAAVVDVGRREITEAAVMVRVVVPREQIAADAARVFERAEPVRKLGAVLQGPELRFRERIVVAHARPRMTGVDAQVREEQRDELAPHGRAAVGMDRELLRGDALLSVEQTMNREAFGLRMIS